MLGVLPLPLVRLHPAMGDDALFGGLDLSGTLAAGHMVAAQGLLARPAAFVLPMAERAGTGLAARLGMMLDAGGGCLIALDEGAEDEALVPALAERLAFGVDLSDVALGDVTGFPWEPEEIATGRDVLPTVTAGQRRWTRSWRSWTPLAWTAGGPGCLPCARRGRMRRCTGAPRLTQADIGAAAELVIAPRATRLPEPATDPPLRRSRHPNRESAARRRARMSSCPRNC